MIGANAEAIEAWNTVLFDKFMRFRDVLTTGLGGHGTQAMKLYAPKKGSRVLDVGCGLGDTTIDLAKMIGNGEAVGVDAASRFIDRAIDEASKAGVKNVTFRVVDVESEDLGGPYDLVFSRMGTMFFANPVRALKNMHSALKPGGELCMVVWRKREDNAWAYVPETVVSGIVPKVDKGDQVTCGPGPFSMASADVVSEQLLRAGFRDVAFERHDIPICIGKNIPEAIDFAMQLGPAGEIMRLAGEEAERRKPEVMKALTDALREFETPKGILAPSSTWFATAIA
jgi:ubiquinone/menaquinone biosynthesis C-methylase UbiE